MSSEKRGIKCTVEIPEHLFKAAQHRAVDERRGGFRGVIVRALEAYLGEKKALPTKKKPARP